MTTAVYPGSFDPPTEGHLNIIRRALGLFDRVIVAVAVNSAKQCAFTPAERVALLKEICGNDPKLEFDTFQDRLLVDYARQKKASAVIRGIRTVQDYEYEFQMALANRQLAPEIETVFLMAESEFAHLSSSLIKEIVAFGGSGKGMVPPLIEKRLKEKLKKR